LKLQLNYYVKVAFRPRISKRCFYKIIKKTIDRVVNAIANIVVADGIIEKHELVALQEAIGLLQDKENLCFNG